MIDKDMKLSLSIDSALDLLFQIKNDRSKLAYKLKESEEMRYTQENIHDSRINGLRQELHELEYENLKLKSRIVELENKLEKYEHLNIIMICKPKEG